MNNIVYTKTDLEFIQLPNKPIIQKRPVKRVIFFPDPLPETEVQRISQLPRVFEKSAKGQELHFTFSYNIVFNKMEQA